MSWDYEVSPQKSKEYRKVEVHVFNLEKYESFEPDRRISYRAQVSPDGYIRVEIANKGKEVISNIVLSQTVDGSIEGLINVRRIISKSPFVVEYSTLTAQNPEKGKFYITIPSLSSNEELFLEYRVVASFIQKPVLVSPAVKREGFRERLVGSYRLYFDKGKVKVEEGFVKKLLADIALLPQGQYEIRVRGYADSTGNFLNNFALARKRAENLVRTLLKSEVACLERDHHIGGLTGTPLDIR